MIFNENDYVVLPANVQAVYCVTNIGVANTPRRVVYPPAGITDTEHYAEPVALREDYALINAEGLTGDIVLEAGFNCAMTTSGNTITINARPGAGASLLESQTGEIPVTAEEEELLASGKYLSRGFKCSELVASINGIEGPSVTLNAGNGIVIDTESEPHTLIIKPDNSKSSGMESCPIPGCN